MAGNFIDLHLHSRYSDDGQFSPEELVQKCKEAGIKTMAIADHNCARANEKGREAAQAAGITYIPAIEIDCTFQAVNLHVLGYGIDDKSRDFADIEDHIRRQGAAASKLMLRSTQELGFDVTGQEMEELAEGTYWKESWTGEMFAEVLLQKPEYLDHPLLLPYRAGGKRGDNPFVNFYWDYYSQGKPCYVKIHYPDLEKITATIHKNGGYAVLAHPGMNLKQHRELLEPILRTGIDGIEAFSSYHTPEENAFFHKAAGDHGLFVTCGSDYHGKTKPAIPIGGHRCEISDKHQLGLPF